MASAASSVVSTRKDEKLEGLTLYLVQDLSLDMSGKDSFVVAVDAMGAGVGEGGGHGRDRRPRLLRLRGLAGLKCRRRRCNGQGAAFGDTGLPVERDLPLEDHGLKLAPLGPGHLPVPQYPPNKCELYTAPSALTSPSSMARVLSECAAIAGELGAREIEVPCPSEIALDGCAPDVAAREFAFAWLRKSL